RRVGAVAINVNRLGEHRLAAAVVEQLEYDVAGRVIAARQRGRVGQGHRVGAERDRGRVGGGGKRRRDRDDLHLLLVGVGVVGDFFFVGVAAVAGDPLVDAGRRAAGRQREALRRVAAVAVDRDRLHVYQSAVPEQLEGDVTGRVKAAFQVRR